MPLVAVSVAFSSPVTPVPAYTLTVTALPSPVAVPAVPENVGVVSLVDDPPAGLVSDTCGALLSTVKLFAELVPVLPALSLWLACAV